jgi:hypothetical protein
MKKTGVLFLGNSHTFYNDMPFIFRRLAEAGGETGTGADMLAHPGVTFGWHLRQAAELRYALLHGGYDYIFLQQAAHSPAPPAADTLRDGAELIRLARLAGVRPVVVLPWAEKRFPEHQALMNETYRKLAADTGVPLSPVGLVFDRVRAERPDIDLYWFDGEHCSPYGSYVNAACAYALVFGKSPRGLPPRSASSLGGGAEDFAELRKLLDKPRETTGEREADAAFMERISREYAERFPPVWDRDKLEVDLDGEKCATLQQWVWEAVSALP